MSSLYAWRERTRRGDIRACGAHSRTSDMNLDANTIKRLLAEHGVAPAPERGKSMSWSTFLKAHWGAIAATDLFTVEVVNPFGLVRYHVPVCHRYRHSLRVHRWDDLGPKRGVDEAGDKKPHGQCGMVSSLANGTSSTTEDPLFTEAVRGLLRDSGVKPLRLPANSPNLNAYAERFVLSIRRECLDRFVPLSERHLRTAVTEYVVHYHTERNHQGLGNELLTPLPASANDAGPIVSRERLWGILNGIVKLTLSERTYRVELTSFALIGRHRLPPARR